MNDQHEEAVYGMTKATMSEAFVKNRKLGLSTPVETSIQFWLAEAQRLLASEDLKKALAASEDKNATYWARQHLKMLGQVVSRVRWATNQYMVETPNKTL